MSGVAHGISNGFTLRSETESMAWLHGDESAAQQREEIGHSVFLGQIHHKTWVGETFTNCMSFGPIATSSLRRVADVNRQVQGEIASSIDFSTYESEVLGEILIDCPSEDRLRLIGNFFMQLAAERGAFHPTITRYLEYVNHGLDLVHQKTQVLAENGIIVGQKKYAIANQEDFTGTANGLCFVSADELSSVTRFEHGVKQALFLSLTLVVNTANKQNILIPAQGIVGCDPLNLKFG